jgi:glyoxylase I family protein
VQDFDKSFSFYTEGLGLDPVHRWGEPGNRAVMLDTGDGSMIEIFEGRPAPVEPEGWYLHIALRTDNCDKAIEAARAAGGTVTVEPKDVDIPSEPPYKVRIAFFKGPDGEILELFQER